MSVQARMVMCMGLTLAACSGGQPSQPSDVSSAPAPAVAAPSGAPATNLAPSSPAAMPSAPQASAAVSSAPAQAGAPAAAPPSAAMAAAPAANMASNPPAAVSGSPPAQPSSGAAAPAKADPPGTVSVSTDPFLLKAGQETYKCQNFDNPFGGKDAAVGRLVTDMAPGSHHLHVYHLAESATRTLESCDSSDFHPLIFTASSPHNEITYPTGMAAKLQGKSGLRIQLHYLNASDSDRMVSATLKLSPVDYASVTKWISELYFNQMGLHIMPGKQTVTSTCTIPNTYGPIGLVAGFSHMHKRGTHFTAMTSTGTKLADVPTWDEPPTIFYDPPVMLNPGDKISWTCEYDNDTGRTLTFGESADTNEMCIYLARFYSAPDGAQLECMLSSPTGTAAARNY